MSGNTKRKVVPGQMLSGFPADMFNGLVDLLGVQGIGQAQPTRPGERAQGVVVRVRNGGAAREKFECAALGTMRWAIDDDGKNDAVWNLNDASATDHPAIVLESIPANKFGRVLVLGYCYAKIATAGSAGHRAGTPSAAGTLTTGDSGPVLLLAAPSTGAETVRPVLIGAGGGGVGTIHIETPPAGIPAMTGSSAPYTPGSATCNLLTWSGSTIATGSGGVTVFNSTFVAIAGSVPAQAKLIDGSYFIDVASCGS